MVKHLRLVVFIVFTLVMVSSLSAQATQTPRLRELDFTPFAEALAAFTPERAAEIGDVVTSATSIIDVHVAVQGGQFSYEELTLWFLDRIQRYDQTLRTYIELNPNALEEARRADQLLAQNTVLSALHGIPVNLKDNIETTAPMHTTGGSEILLNHVPAQDAPLVAQLRAAGAVILGKAGLSEFAGGIDLFHPGFNAVGGQVGNPHGAQFSPSGSSAGSGASTAAYLTMVSVGSETAGSLIAPAAWNGVVGMYPGDGVVDGTGVIPLIANNDTAGPIGRTVTDVAILLGEIDTTDTDYVAGLDAESLNGVQVGVLGGGIISRVGVTNNFEDFSDNEALADQLVAAFQELGATPLPLQGWSGDVANAVVSGLSMFINGGIRHDMMGYLASVGAPATTVEELQAYNLAEPTTRIPFGQGVLDGAVSDTTLADPAAYAEFVAEIRDAAIQTLEATFTETGAGVLVTFNNYESSIYATANYPAVTVPFGLRANGMPIGITFIGRLGSDAQLLSFAYAFEQATNARVTPNLDS
jgi:amidase